jgi:fimbrial chaperone protein
VGLRRAVDPERELAYRLYLQEIPDAVAADGTGVRIALRIGVPVFVPPRAPAAPLLRWQAQRDGNAIVLHAQNTGKSHARILELKFLSGSRAVAETTAAYVLAGQSRRWRFAVSPMPAAGAQLRVSAKTTAGEVNADVVLE